MYLTCGAHGRSAGDEIWDTVTRTATDADGRTAASIAPGALTPGLYRVTFHVRGHGRSAAVPRARLIACLSPLAASLLVQS